MECVHAKSLQLCLTLCDPVNYSPPGSSVHGIFQTRILVVGCHATPGDLPNPRTEPVAPADSLPLSHRGSPQWNITWQKKE